MPRTALTVQSLPAFGGSIDDIAYTAADAANEHEFPHPGGDRCFIITKNKHTGAQAPVLKAVATNQTFQRAVDKTINVAAGSAADKETIVGVPPVGFTQSDGKVHVDVVDGTALSFAVVNYAPTPI